MVAEKSSKSVKKVKKSSTATSVKKRTRKQELMALSNDELFEQIMMKKKEKAKKVVKKSSTVKKVTKTANTNKQSVDLLSSDEIYEKIKLKREKQQEKKKEKENLKTDLPKEEVVSADSSSYEEEILTIKNEEAKKSDFKFFKAIFRFRWVYVFILVALLSFFINIEINEPYFHIEEEEPVNIDDLEASHKLQTNYDECFNRKYDELDNSSDIEEYIAELNSYLDSNYNVSIRYEDLSRGFSYSYNTDKTYYAASTIKSLDALYIYTKAYEGALNLDTTMTYTSNYRISDSFYMNNISYGSEVSLRDLVKYAIIKSDNSAHAMLVDYIGRDNLKKFGRSLGATLTLSGYDNFGYINVDDAIIYMKALDNFFSNGSEIALELKDIFILADQNDLSVEREGYWAAHKYGEYEEFYHDIGIVYDTNPYVVAILTKEGKKSNFQDIVKEINEKIYKLHRMYNDNRENVCYNNVYNK